MHDSLCQGTADARMRLDVFLSRMVPELSRVRAGSLVRMGAVLLNGRVVRKCAAMVEEGDEISVRLDEKPATETRIAGVDLSLPVLYEDESCMVIRKPAGIAVHPGIGLPKDEPTVLHGLVHLFAQRQLPFSSSSVLVHRLDKDTTGCLLIAKSAAAHAALQRQFAERTVGKWYLALVYGRPTPPAAIIDASIGRSSSDRTKMTVMRAARTRNAKTSYETVAVASDGRSSLLCCKLHTGRTHQIRVHLQSIGHSIIGDPSYASRECEQLSSECSINTLCLHAWRLQFVSPDTGKAVACTAECTETFMSSAEALGIDIQRIALFTPQERV